MKKLISLALALVLVLSLSTVAFATETANPTYTDMSTVTIDKTYTVTNEGTSYPNETFKFVVGQTYEVTDGGVGSDKQEMPTIGEVSFVTADGTATKSVTVNLPNYTAVGVYTYTITETAGDTAGVEYYDDTIKLVVTVIVGDDGLIRVAAVHTEATGGAKSNDIDNVYNAGSLSVSKEVTGLLGDTEKYFAITISLTGETGKDYTGNVITVGQTSYADNPTTVTVGTPATFYLKDDETITLGNIPYGVTYTVSEEDLEDYQETITDNDGGKIDAATQTVNVVNNKDGEVDTGISMDSMPYVLLLAVACVGLFVMMSKKRMMREF